MRHFAFILLAILAASPAFAQSEAALKGYFEGMTVVVKLDMPADSSGIDVQPGPSASIDFTKLGRSLKQYGISVHAGASIMVTRVRVKKKQISFQLGGGGFGTFMDQFALGMEYPTTGATYQGKSRREKDLEYQLMAVSDPYTRREIKNEIDDLRRDRNRDNAWSSSMAAQATAAKKDEERAKRAAAGSRFTIRYQQGVPLDAMSPQSVIAALGEWVQFPGDHASFNTARNTRQARPPASSGGGIVALQKGQTVAQVEVILGPAKTAQSDQQGSMEMMLRIYSVEGQRVDARFVSGVLVDYTISPE